MHTEVWLGKHRGRRLQDLGLGERIIVKYILKKSDERLWIGLVWFCPGRDHWLVAVNATEFCIL
jgi:hypothetical protein